MKKKPVKRKRNALNKGVRQLIEETVNKDLIEPFVSENFPHLKPPRFYFEDNGSTNSLNDNAKVIACEHCRSFHYLDSDAGREAYVAHLRMRHSPPMHIEIDSEKVRSDFIKHDKGKVLLDLLPFDALFAVGEVLTFGAKKYTRRGACNCALSAAANQNGSFVSSAETATIDNSKQRIPNTKNDSLQMPELGKRTGALLQMLMREAAQETQQPSDTGSRAKRLTDLLGEVASFAEKENLFASITTTKQGASEAPSVSPATSVSAGSKKSDGLSEHSPTCGVHKEISGAGNWAKGTEWSRYQAAMLRHYTAFAAGENWDVESGLPTLAHLACDALFLLAHQLRGIGTDDRAERQGRKAKS